MRDDSYTPHPQPCPLCYPHCERPGYTYSMLSSQPLTRSALEQAVAEFERARANDILRQIWSSL